MKKIVLIILSLITYSFINAQSVGIGTTLPNPNSALDIVSTDQGLLIPRLDTATIFAMPLGAADDGMLVYADEVNLFAYWDGDSLDWFLINENNNNNNGSDDDWFFNGDTLYNNSEYVIVGSASPIEDIRMLVVSNGLISALAGSSNGDGQNAIGVQGYAQDGSNINIGVYGESVSSSVSDTAVGVVGKTNGAGGGNSYGILGDATNVIGNGVGVFGGASGPGDTLIGIFGDAEGGSVNYAGFFGKGNVYIQNRLGLNIANPNAGIHVNMGTSNIFGLQLTSTGTGFGSGILLDNVRNYSVYSNNGGDFVIGDESAGSGRFQINPAGNITFNNVYTFPNVDGGNGEVLTTDGSGNVSWQTAGGADNLGNHIATTNLEMAGNYISNDGDNEGVFVNSVGHVGINNPSPLYMFEVGVNPVSSILFRSNGAGYFRTNLAFNSPAALTLVNTNSSSTGVSLDLTSTSGASTATRGRVTGLSSGTNEGSLAFTTKTGAGWSEKMRIDHLGNVGIGLTNATSSLEVNGNIAQSREQHKFVRDEIGTSDLVSFCYGSILAGGVDNSATARTNNYELISNGNGHFTINYTGTRAFSGNEVMVQVSVSPAANPPSDLSEFCIINYVVNGNSIDVYIRDLSNNPQDDVAWSFALYGAQ